MTISAFWRVTLELHKMHVAEDRNVGVSGYGTNVAAFSNRLLVEILPLLNLNELTRSWAVEAQLLAELNLDKEVYRTHFFEIY